MSFFKLLLVCLLGVVSMALAVLIVLLPAGVFAFDTIGTLVQSLP